MFGSVARAAATADTQRCTSPGDDDDNDDAFPTARNQDPALPATNIWFEVGGRPDFRPPAARRSRKRPLPQAALSFGTKSAFSAQTLAVATFAQDFREASKARKRARTETGSDAEARGKDRMKPARGSLLRASDLTSSSAAASIAPHYSWETWYDYSKLDEIVKRAVSAKINLTDLAQPASPKPKTAAEKSAAERERHTTGNSQAGDSINPATTLLERLRSELMVSSSRKASKASAGTAGAANAAASTLHQAGSRSSAPKQSAGGASSAKRGPKGRAGPPSDAALAATKRLFSELDTETSYLDHAPKIPRTSMEEKLYSDYFSASKSKYKSRIARFVRDAQGKHDVANTMITPSYQYEIERSADSERMDQLQKKSRFSFKGDGIVAVSQVIDVFCQGLLHEATRAARRRHPHAALAGDEKPYLSLSQDDMNEALQHLGWDVPRLKLK
ncbi:Hypothetical Protein FCC1311_020312 [Hondaea fermentalgiana]|uniref:Uncharacterized protein n=1 Tax=Hondaea fermentalgiana TaxID=2315210 RepID=A0A2R5G455_9STRA|nr:Hypothetical Protein FCC1311_020312 [Hondaea fermentalgiana]|eukprot:GBG25812.1 Hypothetical Protein FCC1311_020312 [Hondaea fermentalgiana]